MTHFILLRSEQNKKRCGIHRDKTLDGWMIFGRLIGWMFDGYWMFYWMHVCLMDGWLVNWI